MYLEHSALRADDDTLLALSFHVNGGDDASDLGLFFPEIDHDGDRVGDLLPGREDDLFANEFGSEETLRLIGDVVGRKVGGTFGQARQNGAPQFVKAVRLSERKWEYTRQNRAPRDIVRAGAAERP